MPGVRSSDNWRSPQTVPTASAGSLPWFLFRTKPRQEQRASLAFQQWGAATFLPTVSTRRGKDIVISPLFPGYIFSQFPPSFLLKASITPGILGPVRFGSTVAIVSPAIIEGISSRLDDRGCLLPQSSVAGQVHQFHAGERVVVTDGPLRGLTAAFDCYSGKDLARIMVSTVQHYAGGTSCDRELQDLKGSSYGVRVKASHLALA